MNRRLYGTQGGQFKLYSPVVVEDVIADVKCRYIGEVMSMKTTEGTYMVRQVPQHPGTLIEVKEAQLSEPVQRAKRWWIHYAAIEPVNKLATAQIPVDMLRYENAAPANFLIVQDETFVTAQLKQEFLSGRGLLIAQTSTNRTPIWSYGRWESFSWRLFNLHTEEWRMP